MTEIQRFAVGNVMLTRAPYFDAALPPEAVAFLRSGDAALEHQPAAA